MANIRSAQKRVRQNKVRTSRNKALKTRVKNARRALVQAIEDGDAQNAGSKFRELVSVADRAAKTNVIHKNSASRIRRLFSQRVNALG